MSLSELSSRDAVLTAIQEYDRLGSDAFLKKYGFRPAREYMLEHEGRLYDSKAIVGAAYGVQYPDRGPLKSEAFSGGQYTVEPTLQRLGFSIVRHSDKEDATAPDVPLSREHFDLFQKYKQAKDHAFSRGIVTAEDKGLYFELYNALQRAAARAIADPSYADNFRLRLSRFSKSGGVQGQRPLDMWSAAINAESEIFGGYPQVYAIASETGLEIGFAVSINESDYYNAAVKVRNRLIVPVLNSKLPAPESDFVTSLDKKLAAESGWVFAIKTRQGPQGAFNTFADLTRHLKSAQSSIEGGGAIYRIFSPSEVTANDFHLDQTFSAALSTFAPLMRLLVPTSEDSAKLEDPEPDEDIPIVGEASASQRVWLYAPGRNADLWDDHYEKGIMAIGWGDLGDLRGYATLEEVLSALNSEYPSENRQSNNARTCFDFAHTMKIGDLVFAKRGRGIIIGHGTVTGDYEYHPDRPDFRSIRKVRWESRGEWETTDTMAMKTLTEITGNSTLVEHLRHLVSLHKIEPQNPLPAEARENYSVDDAMVGLFLPREEVERALRIWRSKKNLILQGPPGVGKSFLARRLAYALMGYRDPTRVRTVQFHQSYSYEDFVQGYRPDGQRGFELKAAVFMEFCERARLDPDETYVFIIDEINRGNLSRIFGELMLLIEPDKRSPEWATKLAYAKSGEERFYVPPNVHILGLMNTADRSLSLVDYALRRRFGFVTLKPQFDQSTFAEVLEQKGVAPELVTRIVVSMTDLNAEISGDKTNLGPGFCIGHSFFVPSDTSGSLDGKWYEEIIESEVRPLLEEYWSDDLDHADKAIAKLLSK